MHMADNQRDDIANQIALALDTAPGRAEALLAVLGIVWALRYTDAAALLGCDPTTIARTAPPLIHSGKLRRDVIRDGGDGRPTTWLSRQDVATRDPEHYAVIAPLLPVLIARVQELQRGPVNAPTAEPDTPENSGDTTGTAPPEPMVATAAAVEAMPEPPSMPEPEPEASVQAPIAPGASMPDAPVQSPVAASAPEPAPPVVATVPRIHRARQSLHALMITLAAYARIALYHVALGWVVVRSAVRRARNRRAFHRVGIVLPRTQRPRRWPVAAGTSALLAVGAIALLTVTARGYLGHVTAPAPAQLSAAPTGAQQTSGTTALPSPTIEPRAPARSPVPVALAIVVGTADAGLIVRATPGGARVGHLPDGALVRLLDPPHPYSGINPSWVLVEHDALRGWVARSYLVTQ